MKYSPARDAGFEILETPLRGLTSKTVATREHPHG